MNKQIFHLCRISEKKPLLGKSLRKSKKCSLKAQCVTCHSRAHFIRLYDAISKHNAIKLHCVQIIIETVRKTLIRSEKLKAEAVVEGMQEHMAMFNLLPIASEIVLDDIVNWER